MASEKLRQREVHKYYQYWLESSVGLDTNPALQLSRYHEDGSQFRISKDKALIAFAQLGCLRLDVKRSVVTLISTDQQYILAEATKTLSLVSGDGDSKVQDEIWFGNASLPRSQGVSGDALHPASYTATSASGSSYTAPALVINDLTLDERYKSRPYAGKGVTFYCGVPILTDTGIPIGVYTVTDDKPRNGLEPHELRFMHDMAATVMRHLEVISGEAARFRGETMVIGLGKFISGAQSMHDDSSEPAKHTPREPAAKPESSDNQSSRLFKGITITAATPAIVHSIARETDTPESKGVHTHKSAKALDDASHHVELGTSGAEGTSTDAHCRRNMSTAKQKDENHAKEMHPDAPGRNPLLADDIFSRAAKILRECVAADGVLFFDAISTNFTTSAHRAKLDVPRDATGQDLYGRQLESERKDSTISHHSGASEESDVGVTSETEKKMCKLLGHDLNPTSPESNEANFLDNIQLTERSLSRLVKMYPEGKLFSFNNDGEFSASDGEILTQTSRYTSKNVKTVRASAWDGSRRIPRAIAGELERLVPYAQSIVWLPLWDFSKQRWSAGLFLWSRKPDRMVTAQDDLVYLKAFANSIMVEVARLDAAIADTAKSTFIANISHELRTPLHGILGNLDILQDTKLNEFQQSLLTAIEVCGRTLSDTIDHVLDYSKINQLSKQSRKRNQSSSMLLPLLSHSTTPNANSTVEQDFDLAFITEEAVEAAYASYTFQSSGRTTTRATSLSGTRSPVNPSAALADNPRVNIIFEVDYCKSWRVRSQASAIRRVVTNLFGNALKYTDSGTIQVMLSPAQWTRPSKSKATVSAILTIKDTGRGMSSDFVRNHAFTPFRQESQFSTGTGLGLSIVQQIVKSLNGKVELQSNQGVGTEVRVFLDLPQSDSVENTPSNVVSSRSRLIAEIASGRSLVIVSTHTQLNATASLGQASIVTSIEKMAKDWYGLRVTCTHTLSKADVDIILYMTPPTTEAMRAMLEAPSMSSQTRFIILVANTIQKAAILARYSNEISEWTDRIEVLSLPIGPQKLGQSLLRHLQVLNALNNADCVSATTSSNEAPLFVPLSGTAAPSDHATDEMEIDSHDTRERVATQSHSSLPQPSKYVEVDPVDLGAHSLQDSTTFDEPKSESLRTSGTALKRSASPSWNSSQNRPSVILPRSISAPATALPMANSVSQHSSLRVLLVDDNDINLNILKTCMKRAQIPFDFAKDGLEASNTFQHAFKTRTPFTHVLMDISMPVMDGIQSTREIREFERQQSNLSRVASRKREPDLIATTLPAQAANTDIEHEEFIIRAFIIALSGVASEDTQLEMLEAGADMFLPKPVKLRELLKLLAT